MKVDKTQTHVTRQTSEALTSVTVKTDWHPLQDGGANFKTAELRKVSSGRIQTVKSKSGYLFASVMSAVGLVGFGILFYNLLNNLFDRDTWLPVAVCWIFGGIGLALFYFPRPRIFDKSIGWYWLGSPKLRKSLKISSLKQACQLHDIIALQIIDEYISSTDSDGHSSNYHSYELNLVLHDGSRLNVMDHGNKQSLMADANMLSDFLDVPILTM